MPHGSGVFFLEEFGIRGSTAFADFLSDGGEELLSPLEYGIAAGVSRTGIAQKFQQIQVELQQVDSGSSLPEDVSRQFDQLRLVATARTSLAHIDQAVNKSRRISESTVSAIEEYTLTCHLYEPKGIKPMEKPAVKPRRVVEIRRFIQKPFLENETEVEDFLSKLRTELHDSIAKNERIQIK
jgi:hypothetical protein